MADTQRTAQELADDIELLRGFMARNCMLTWAEQSAGNEALSRLAALASQAEPVARVIRNEAGQVYIEWCDGKTPLDFVGASLYVAAIAAKEQS